MGLIQWFQRAFSPAKLTTGTPVVGRKPLWEQFTRIGGNLTPADVSRIIRDADGGQPASFVDLTNESQQKDSHFQSVVGTRERAVALVDLEFVEPVDATAQEKEAGDLCRRIRDDFENWPTLIEHLTGAFRFGHSTAEVPWEKTDGLVIPVRAQPIPHREFIFSSTDGSLRYRKNIFDQIGIDLLAENPGRIVQLQRRITGDVPAREGLARVLVWAALLRNWSLRDWVALGEIGWKPWALAKYKQGTQQKDIDDLVAALERVGSSGIGAFPEETGVTIEWPKGTVGGGGSTHKELFDTLGREMSKGVLGTTTSVESGPHGTKGDTAVRDEIRNDIRESDARAVAACLRYQLFAPAVAINIGGNVRCPVPWFQTEETADQKEFSEAVKNLVEAGLRVPAKWARDEIGMPEPLEGEEVLEPPKPVAVQVPPGAPVPGEDPADPEAVKPGAKRAKSALPQGQPGQGGTDGREYTDRVERSTREMAAKELAPVIAGIVSAVQGAGSYQEAKAAMLEKYRGMFPPLEFAQKLEGALLMTQSAGVLAVNEDTPELTGDK